MKIYLKEKFEYDGITFNIGVYELNKEGDKFYSIDNDYLVIDYAIYENNKLKFNEFKIKSNDSFPFNIYENTIVFILNKGNNIEDTKIYYKPYTEEVINKYCNDTSKFYLSSNELLKEVKEFNEFEIDESVKIIDYSLLKDSYIHSNKHNSTNTTRSTGFDLKEYKDKFKGLCVIISKVHLYTTSSGGIKLVIGIKSKSNYSCVTELNNIQKVNTVDVLSQLETEFGELSF